MKLNSNPEVKKLIKRYPKNAQEKLNQIRDIILRVASQKEDIKELEETLKWGEPSYLSKIGSTIRMDWKEKNPDQVAVYFKCTSKLVPTFKMIFGDQFKYEKNRAIYFKLDDEIPESELESCIEMALRYHKLKKLSLLGFKSKELGFKDNVG